MRLREAPGYGIMKTKNASGGTKYGLFFVSEGRRAREALGAAGGISEKPLLRVRSLQPEHVHRARVGAGQRGSRHLQPRGAGLRPVGGGHQVRGHDGHDSDGQASRRLLPVAEPIHRALHEKQPLQKRQGRRGARGGGGLPPRRHPLRLLPVPVGSQQPVLRHRRVQRLL